MTSTGGSGWLRGGSRAAISSGVSRPGWRRRRDHQIGHRPDEREQADPEVDAQAEDVVRGVDAQHLPHGPADDVRGDVQGEHPSVPHPPPPVGPDAEGRDADAPQRLVEERRVERRDVGIALRAVGRVDAQPPRQGRRATEELLVEPVAPAPGRLGQDDARRESVRHRRERDSLAVAGDPGPDATEDDRAPDAETAVPDLERVHRVAAGAEVRLRRRQQVIEPAPEDPERHGPHGDVSDGPSSTAPLPPTTVAEPDGDEDADDDAERVPPDRERSEVPHPLVGAGDRREHPASLTPGQERVRTPSASSRTSARSEPRPSRGRRSVEQPSHEGGPDDDAVGIAGHLGGLRSGAHAEPDAHRDVGRLADAGDQRRARARWSALGRRSRPSSRRRR